jgi:hypothetical protein
MEIRTLVILFVVILVMVVILLVIWPMRIRRRFASRSMISQFLEAISVAKPETDEFVASPVSEEIETLVRHKLASYADLADLKIDFGTAADGSLQIWLGDECYEAVESIPDARIRAAIEQAVTDYNR